MVFTNPETFRKVCLQLVKDGYSKKDSADQQSWDFCVARNPNTLEINKNGRFKLNITGNQLTSIEIRDAVRTSSQAPPSTPQTPPR